MIYAGIVDPTKVTRSALQNASSVASMVLTTESLVSDKKEPAAPAHAMQMILIWAACTNTKLKIINLKSILLGGLFFVLINYFYIKCYKLF